MKLARPLVAALLLVIMFSASTVFACGPFSIEAIFVHTVHPAYPLDRFAQGRIGVIQPTYARSYLYVAYRYLAGSRFNETEQKQLVELWKDRLDNRFNLGEEEWIKAWSDARQRVTGLGESPKIEVYRTREKPNDYESFLNCQKDAFDVAVQTLNDRITKFGVDNQKVRAWTEAQDQVFANCGEGKNVPAALDTSEDPLARADRNYQIAAANFYAGDFDEARKAFSAIAADNSSPWQPVAAYLVARTLVRKASLGPAESRDASLNEAETLLKNIIGDKKLERSHAAAVRLAGLVRLRFHPQERLRELAQALVNPSPNSTLKQQLWDYTDLLDKYLETDDGEFKTPPEDIRGDDLTDWLATIEEGTDKALSHALERWEQTHSTPWLVNVLGKVKGAHPKSTSLISEAMKVNQGPAFLTLRFHAVRLLFEAGKTTEARDAVNELLTERVQFDESSVNLLRSQRMLLATNLNDLLSFTARVPAALSWNDDGREVPAEPEELSPNSKALATKSLFDIDAANVINRQLPLSLLKVAGKSPVLPENLRRDLVQAAWLRAVILGNDQIAAELTPELSRLVPGIAPLVDPFLSAPSVEAKRFAAIYAWLKFPGLEPIVDRGVSRETLSEQDIYRDNWWCTAAFPTTPTTEKEDSSAADPFVAPSEVRVSFLSAAERETARKERLTLDSIGAAPNYICQQVIQWATKSPEDPRVPEALHLAVKTTRYGCTDKDSGRWSKAAFDLLHRKYPNSTWAKKTPYWFKD